MKIIFVVVLVTTVASGQDLYALLGVSKSANQSEIKAAYRRKARETHPDKNREMGVDDANERFREIVHAFEVLSDSEARRNYDQHGDASKTRQNDDHRQRNQQPWFTWNHFHFGHQRYVHPHLLNPFLRQQIQASQSRVVRIHSLHHLRSLLISEGEDLERYFLLAFVSSSAECLHRLNNILLFPWPFAGYSSWDQSETVFWDEIMQVGVINVAPNDPASIRVAEYFSVDVSRRCPAIVLLNRKQNVNQINDSSVHYPQTSEQFHGLVWPSLKVKISFINRSLWPLNFWWLDGNIGNRLGVLEIGEQYTTDTYLSHTFIFRPTLVGGSTLTNESSLLWYAARLADDQSTVEILPRCFDVSGECKRWAQEGFCDTRQKSFYVLQNPDFAPYVQRNCLLSCRRRCPGEELRPSNPEWSYHTSTMYHTSDEL